ncbi:hypothetical protein ACVA51_13420 [Pseudomonas luteola]
MAQDIHGLLVQIEATTAGLRRELSVADQAVAKATGQIDNKLGQVDAAFDRVGDSAKDAQAKINASMTGIASGITVALTGLAALTAHAADSAKELKNLSLVSNTSTAEFQRYAAGAKTVGIEQDKLADIFKDTNDKLGDFLQNGGGELQDFFKNIAPKVGLTAEAFKNLSGPQALQLYYTSLEKAGVNQQAMTTYMESIADEATALIPLLRSNGQGFKELGDQAQKAGAILSDIQIDQLVQVGKAVDGLKLQFQGATNELVSGMVPGVLEVTQKLQGLTDNGAMKTLGEGIGFLVGNLDVLVALLGAKAASAFVGYTQQVMASVTATSTSVAANIQQAKSALEVAVANQRAAETARIRAAMEATAAKGTAVQTQMSIQLAEARMAEAAATSRVAAAQTALRAAQTGILSLLGGPAGIAALAIGAGVAFLTMGSNAKESASDLNALKEPLDQISAKFKQLSKDQQGAQLAKLSLDQKTAAEEASEAYQGFLDTIKQDIGGTMAGRLAGEFNAAREAGKPLSDVIDDIGRRLNLSPETINSWKIAAGASNEADQSLQRVNTTITALTEQTKQNTVATQENNAARAGMSTAGNQYLGTLQKQLQGLQDNGDAIKSANRYIADNKDLTEADRVAILSAANAIESQKKANQAATQATKDSNKATSDAANIAKQQAKALEDLVAKSKIETDAAIALAQGYREGKDNLYEYTLQQKVEQELLKTGAKSREAVTKAIQDQMDAAAGLDISKSIYDLQKETDQLIAQATATLQGTDALEAYNNEKTLSSLLAGKNAEALGTEVDMLRKVIAANQQATKALEDAGKVQGILDRLDPQAKAARDYADEVEVLNDAMERYPEKAGVYRQALEKLGVEYENNKRQATAWGQFTEGAVDRIDDAFADGWKNIDKGFKGFASSLIDGFKQLLAELAHMAITKPIIMQIGAALGVGGLSGAANASGLLGGSGGGMDIMSLARSAQQLYGVASSSFGQAVAAGWSSGGFSGALSGGYNSVSSGIGSLFSGTQGGAGVMLDNAGNIVNYGSGAAWGSAGSALSGVGGALYGYQQSGLKGAVTGGAGAYVGAALGSITGPIGTAIGAALGGYIGGSLFGGKWQTKDVGLSLGVSGGDLDAQQYEYQKKKGGLFGSNKKRTRYSDLDDATQSALDATFDNLASTSQDIFTKLGIQVGDGALDGLNVAATQISTKDKSEEEINQAISDWFGGVADQMVTTINDATGQQLSGVVINGGLNFEGVSELANNLYSINGILDSLHLTAQALTVDGALANQALMNLAGGMDALKTNTSTYYANFFSEAERNQDTVDAVRKQFQALNITMPETREGFRAAVEALDLTTAAGQDMFTKLTALAGNAATAYTILEQNATAAQNALMTGVNDAFTALQSQVQKQQQTLTDAYNAQINSLNDMLSTSQSNIQGLTSVSNSLKNALRQLTGQSDDAVRTLRAQAQATLQSALSTARAGGSLAGFDLSDALSTVSETNSNLYSSYEDMARDQGRTANVVAELNGYADKQLTTEQQTLAKLQTQIDTAKAGYEAESARLDAIVDHAQAQIDALNGINNGVQTLAQLIANMNGAVNAAAPTGTGTTNSSNLISSAYRAAGISMDAAGAAYWQAQLASGALNSSNIGEAIRNAAVQNGQIPAFASGGDHMGGLRLVGENGPELEVTGPSRIYNNSDTMKMLGGGSSELIAEVRALRQENAEMRQYFYAIAKNTDKTARGIQQQNETMEEV